MTERLFVYGSLRRGVPGSRHQLLGGEARFAGVARVRGRLLGLGEYPGLLPAPGSWVQGEVYVLDDPVRTLARLDEYEGCGPEDPEPHEFERVETEVVHAGGETLPAWVYVYRGPTAGAAEIPSGDYLLHSTECARRSP